MTLTDSPGRWTITRCNWRVYAIDGGVTVTVQPYITGTDTSQSGAAYGGRGGRGNNGTPGDTYGSADTPDQLGSGGGLNDGNPGTILLRYRIAPGGTLIMLR